jgi:hypothetical protein
MSWTYDQWKTTPPEEQPGVPDIEKAICTICAYVESPGFYTGCMFNDGLDCNGWECDGRGNLTRAR